MYWQRLWSRLSHARHREMIQAVRDGNIRTVRRLLAQGVSPNASGHFGLTALMVAVQIGRARIASDLVEAGADVNRTDVGGETAWTMAVRLGNSEIVQILKAASTR